jgi:hypothetical protein
MKRLSSWRKRLMQQALHLQYKVWILNYKLKVDGDIHPYINPVLIAAIQASPSGRSGSKLHRSHRGCNRPSTWRVGYERGLFTRRPRVENTDTDRSNDNQRYVLECS